MLRFVALVLSIFFSLTFVSPLSAFSVGRDGASYTQDGIQWQNVYYKDDDVGFTGTLPGSPQSGIANRFIYSMSEYNGVFYEYHVTMGERIKPPKKEKDFINELNAAYGTVASVTPIKPTQKIVKYCAEISFKDGTTIARVFCSRNCLYWAIVQGPDLSLAPYVFDSFRVTK